MIFQVDGDTDTAPVQEDFNNVIKQHIQFIQESKLNNKAEKMMNGRMTNGYANGRVQNGHIPNRDETTIHDLEELDTISRHVANGVANGRIANGIINGKVPNGKAIGNGFLNGKLNDLESQRRENIRNIYQGYPLDNHI